MDERELEREIAGLYQRPLAEFIAARSDIEARLREGGDPRSADRVKRLRKPSLSAWTIDQLAGRDRGDLAALLTLGNELRAAQRRALAGGGGTKLQARAAERRRLIDRLLDGARQVLQEAGHPASRSQLDQVEHTLLATATDQALAERVRGGTLDREAPPPSDFGGLSPDELESTSVRRPAFRGRGPEGRTDRSREDRRPTEADRRLERARRRADDLARTADEAESEARRLRQESNTAARHAAKAKASAERAEARAADARTRANRARREAG